jgi:hypothetical protein
MGKIMVKINTASLHVAAMASERQHYWSSRFEQFNMIVERAIERGEFPP